MEGLVAAAVGVMTAGGVWLVLRARSWPVLLGLALLTYAVNFFLFASGKLALNLPPVLLQRTETYADPLPQALTLTAIVIAFGMAAVITIIALRAWLESGSDAVDTAAPGTEPGPDAPRPPAGREGEA